MMALALLPSEAHSGRCHASEDDYAAFLRARNNTSSTVVQMLRRRRRFVRVYPDLEAWFAVPLAERVGRLYGEDDHHPSFPAVATPGPISPSSPYVATPGSIGRGCWPCPACTC